MTCNQNCHQGRSCNCGLNPDYTQATLKLVQFVVFVVVMIAAITVAGLVTAAPKESYQDRVNCLSEAVYHEARGEPYNGMLAVAQTVLNRTKHPGYPKTVCGVVFQKGQFSWTESWPKTWRADYYSRQVAMVALMGTHSLKDFKATHFHNSTVKPRWNHTKIAKIGNHTFYEQKT